MPEVSELDTHIEEIEKQLHKAVENDDDQALFIASYLHGHFDLVVSQVLHQSKPSLSLLDSTMRDSLNNAFENKELVESDQQQVMALWTSLLQGRQFTA